MTSPPCMGARDTRCHPDPGMCACFVASDPNHDLIGFQYPSGIETVTVLGSASWSDKYVQVRYPSGFETIQRAELVRQKKLYIEGGDP